MDYRKEIERMMESQTSIALATAANGNPNVRIVNFYYDPQIGSLYFCTFRDNQKVAEFHQLPHVAFTTIPTNGEAHVRVKSAIVCKSLTTIEEIKPKFLAKMPEHIISNPDVLPSLDLIEVLFDLADVVLDFEHMATVVV